MKKRMHWEIKSAVSESLYKEFALWCVARGLKISSLLRIIALAAQKNDKRLEAIMKDYDADLAKP